MVLTIFPTLLKQTISVSNKSPYIINSEIERIKSNPPLVYLIED